MTVEAVYTCTPSRGRDARATLTRKDVRPRLQLFITPLSEEGMWEKRVVIHYQASDREVTAF